MDGSTPQSKTQKGARELKKSTRVTLTFLTALAALATAACKEERRCVNETGEVMPDTCCQKVEADTSAGYLVRYHPYFWYYGGRIQSGRVIEGSYTPRPSSSFSSHPSSIQRGGFGGTGSGRSVIS